MRKYLKSSSCHSLSFSFVQHHLYDWLAACLPVWLLQRLPLAQSPFFRSRPLSINGYEFIVVPSHDPYYYHLTCRAAYCAQIAKTPRHVEECPVQSVVVVVSRVSRPGSHPASPASQWINMVFIYLSYYNHPITPTQLGCTFCVDALAVNLLI